MQKLCSTQRSIMALTRTMRVRHVQIIKLVLKGETNIAIAKATGLSPPSISKVKNSPKGKRLLALLTHYAQATDGANEAQRRNMLWRVAVDNEQTKPSVAISAITELNRMTGVGQPESAATGQAPVVVINQQLLPKGALDA